MKQLSLNLVKKYENARKQSMLVTFKFLTMRKIFLSCFLVDLNRKLHNISLTYLLNKS